MKATVASILGSFLLVPPAYPLALADLPVDQLIANSTIIAEITVLSISAECKSRYTCGGYRIGADVVEIIKADSQRDKTAELAFCSKIPLEAGHSYTVFLYSPDRDPISLEGCSDVLGHSGAFEDRAGDYYRVNSPDGAAIFQRDGNTYYSNAVMEPGFGDLLEHLRN